ncbi:amino acid transporter [Entomoplasma freundtii]|uniref:Uncharacterized protein n=1 Tax=Entomoplasma freundtii TaxID=74700 RepID=A0A2K8NS83_9MOLU|nr:APC family permease [Entomoplasma freundtii]ATZ16614.1 hypothetical protein EFREU_v1c05940 [Entomoplasma freundtii]TDY58219.1 amino acid transporter [Entomoplasma freundtii]
MKKFKKLDLKERFRVSRNDTQIGLKQLVWLGFNYTCSMGFTLTLSRTFGGKTGVGMHLFWIIILGAIVAGGAAWAFAKCAEVYSDKNGGAFEYTRRTFGRFNGWMVGFYQYVLIPVTTPASILVILAVAFQGMYDPTMWGSEEQTRLYLNLISIGIYVCLSLLVLLGTKVFKIATNLTSGVKWVLLIMVYVAAIIIMVDTKGGNFKDAANTGELTSHNFNTAFSAFFYAYTGFETFAAVGENVKNPKKTMPKAIMLVLMVAVIFYMVGLVFVMGSLGGTINENPNNQIIQLGLGAGSLVIVGISNIAANINGFMQGAFYSGGMLQPLVDQKMITTKVAVLNKQGLAVKALFLNMILTVLFSLFWLVLPYILNNNAIDYTSLVGFNSIVMFIVYGYVISAALVLSYKKKTSSSWFVYAIWISVLAFLGYQCVMYFVDFQTNKWQILTFGVVTTLAISWYFLGATLQQKQKFYNYRIKKLEQLLANTTSETQKEKLSAKLIYINDQQSWVIAEIAKGKQSYQDLIDWKDTEDYKEIMINKGLVKDMKERALLDGSKQIYVPKFILKNKVNRIKKENQETTKNQNLDYLTKIELQNLIQNKQ